MGSCCTSLSGFSQSAYSCMVVFILTRGSGLPPPPSVWCYIVFLKTHFCSRLLLSSLALPTSIMPSAPPNEIGSSSHCLNVPVIWRRMSAFPPSVINTRDVTIEKTTFGGNRPHRFLGIVVARLLGRCTRGTVCRRVVFMCSGKGCSWADLKKPLD